MRTATPKDAVIKLRVPKADKDRLQQAAAAAGISLSDFIRQGISALASHQ